VAVRLRVFQAKDQSSEQCSVIASVNPTMQTIYSKLFVALLLNIQNSSSSPNAVIGFNKSLKKGRRNRVRTTAFRGRCVLSKIESKTDIHDGIWSRQAVRKRLPPTQKKHTQRKR
jgi:hypothetical protein